MKFREEKPNVFGLEVGKYFNLFWLPVIIILAIEIVLYYTEYTGIYNWFARLVLFMYLGWMVNRKHQATFAQSAYLGAFAGFILGLLMAIFELIVDWEFFLLLNLIRLSFLVAAFGAVISGATNLIIKSTKSVKS